VTVWALWVLYTAIVDYEPQSEIPRWFSYAAAVVLLTLGATMLILGRLVHRQSTS
jgi:hypothetical protein